VLQRVVIRHFQRHPRIASHNAEHQQKQDRKGAKSVVYEAVRDVDPLEAPVQRVPQNENKVVLLQSVPFLDDIDRISRAANTCGYALCGTRQSEIKLLNL